MASGSRSSNLDTHSQSNIENEFAITARYVEKVALQPPGYTQERHYIPYSDYSTITAALFPTLPMTLKAIELSACDIPPEKRCSHLRREPLPGNARECAHGTCYLIEYCHCDDNWTVPPGAKCRGHKWTGPGGGLGRCFRGASNSQRLLFIESEEVYEVLSKWSKKTGMDFGSPGQHENKRGRDSEQEHVSDRPKLQRRGVMHF